MNIGKMRFKIKIETPTNLPDKDGFINETWTEFKTVWCDIVPVSGKEYFANNQNTNEIDYKIYIRNINGLSSKERINYHNKFFNIVSILENEHNEFTTLMCKVVN